MQECWNLDGIFVEKWTTNVANGGKHFLSFYLLFNIIFFYSLSCYFFLRFLCLSHSYNVSFFVVLLLLQIYIFFSASLLVFGSPITSFFLPLSIFLMSLLQTHSACADAWQWDVCTSGECHKIPEVEFGSRPNFLPFATHRRRLSFHHLRPSPALRARVLETSFLKEGTLRILFKRKRNEKENVWKRRHLKRRARRR